MSRKKYLVSNLNGRWVVCCSFSSLDHWFQSEAALKRTLTESCIIGFIGCQSLFTVGGDATVMAMAIALLFTMATYAFGHSIILIK
jgi:hypothetical protein